MKFRNLLTLIPENISEDASMQIIVIRNLKKAKKMSKVCVVTVNYRVNHSVNHLPKFAMNMADI